MDDKQSENLYDLSKIKRKKKTKKDRQLLEDPYDLSSGKKREKGKNS